MALQAILESDFFNAVREVYEHVHETVDIQGDPEVRANATAKVSYQGLISQTNQHLIALNIWYQLFILLYRVAQKECNNFDS